MLATVFVVQVTKQPVRYW